MIISVQNFKGGCGKTTTSYNLAYTLYKRNYKTLLIDMTPQGNLTDMLSKIDSDLLPTIYDIGDNDVDISSLIRMADKLNGFDIEYIPGNYNIEKLNQLFTSNIYKGKSSYYDPVITLSDYYDYIIIDSHNNLTLIEQHSFALSDLVLIPIDCMDAARNLSQTLQLINGAEKYANKTIHYKMFFNAFKNINPDNNQGYDNEPRDQKEIRNHISNEYSNFLLNTIIRNLNVVSTSRNYGIPAQVLDNSFTDYDRLLDELYMDNDLINILPKEDNHGKT